MNSRLDVRGRLDRLKMKHPELRSLIDNIPATLLPSPELFVALRRSRAPYGRKSLIMRVLLADHRLFAGETPSLDQRCVDAIAAFAEHHPSLPMDPLRSRAVMHRDDWPNHLGLFIGRRITTPRDVINELVLRPVCRQDRGQEPFGHLMIQTERELNADVLRPLYQRALLNDADVALMLRKKTSPYQSAYYFDTAEPAINVRNTLFFMRAFLDADRRGGRLQNKIPAALSSGCGIPRLSIPYLQFAADLAGLVGIGALDVTQLPHGQVLTRFLSALHEHLNFEDTRALAEDLAGWFLLDPAKSDAEAERKREGERISLYRTGAIFNTRRLVYGGARAPVFGDLSPYYDAVLTDRLYACVRRHFECVGDAAGHGLARRCKALEPEISGIRARDLANALYHAQRLAQQGDNPYATMPTVALYALGMREVLATGTGRGGWVRSGKKAGNGQTAWDHDEAPLLDAVVPRLPQAR